MTVSKHVNEFYKEDEKQLFYLHWGKHYKAINGLKLQK